MSRLIATISQIQKCESLHLVHFICEEQNLSMMSLDLDKKIQIGTKVTLAIKPSHIAIAKDFSGEVSFATQLACTIVNIENGKLLSSIELRFGNSTLESIITLSSSLRMKLKVGDTITAFIKASELSMVEVL